MAILCHPIYHLLGNIVGVSRSRRAHRSSQSDHICANEYLHLRLLLSNVQYWRLCRSILRWLSFDSKRKSLLYATVCHTQSSLYTLVSILQCTTSISACLVQVRGVFRSVHCLSGHHQRLPGGECVRQWSTHCTGRISKHCRLLYRLLSRLWPHHRCTNLTILNFTSLTKFSSPNILI